MSRLPLTFGCGGKVLCGTLDLGPAKSGLLLVTGGNEIRSGAFSGQARLAARIAAKGFPVFRFDRRGIGDSEGTNRGFRHSLKDIEAAIDAFRSLVPSLERVVGFGNCDAASALMLGGGAGCDALVLSNPWTFDEAGIATDQKVETSGPAAEAMPSSAIRARYLAKLANPREVWRLLSGGVDLRKLASGIAHSLRRPPPASGLAQEMAAGLARFDGPARILLASADRTAQAFDQSWPGSAVPILRCAGATHGWVEPQARDFLDTQLIEALGN